MKRLLLVPIVLVLAGCGGGGGTGNTNGGGGSEAPPAGGAPNQRAFELQIAYKTALNGCSAQPLKELASVYGVEAKPEAVADAVAQEQDDPGLAEQARKGCLAAFGK